MAKEGLGLEITELRLGLPGVEGPKIDNKKRVYAEVCNEANSATSDERKVVAKSQLVGWPPVCSYRRKNIESSKMYVKVSMDGAPFLRKIDLGLYTEYQELVLALEKLFGCFGIGKAMKDAESGEYIPIYEDKDGDWMLVGDVPWQMFTETCKRLRIMKRSEAKGLGLQRGALKRASYSEICD